MEVTKKERSHQKRKRKEKESAWNGIKQFVFGFGPTSLSLLILIISPTSTLSLHCNTTLHGNLSLSLNQLITPLFSSPSQDSLSFSLSFFALSSLDCAFGTMFFGQRVKERLNLSFFTWFCLHINICPYPFLFAL